MKTFFICMIDFGTRKHLKIGVRSEKKREVTESISRVAIINVESFTIIKILYVCVTRLNYIG